MQPTTTKRVRKRLHFGGCQSGKTVRQFILNSDKNFQGNQNQEIITCSFVKVDFQASLTKSKIFNLIFWIKNYKLLHTIICKIRNMCELANNQVQWTKKNKTRAIQRVNTTNNHFDYPKRNRYIFAYYGTSRELLSWLDFLSWRTGLTLHDNLPA